MRLRRQNHTSFADFPLATNRFPRQIRYAEQGRGVLQMFVDSLETLRDVPKDAFTPPSRATSLPWCEDEKLPRPERLGGGEPIVGIVHGLSIPGVVISVSGFFPDYLQGWSRRTRKRPPGLRQTWVSGFADRRCGEPARLSLLSRDFW